MSKILVFGHQNPDTDAIASSYGFDYLSQKAFGLDTEVVALGTPNEETAFALDYFGVEAPRVVESAKAEGAEQVILTDHNEFQQSIADIREVEVYGVVDHHRVANFRLLIHCICEWNLSVLPHLSFTVCLKKMVLMSLKRLLECSCLV